MTDTPATLGYRMPAEWERHEGTWISWPKDPDTFPADILPKVEAAYARMVDALSRDEEVKIMVNDPRTGERASSMLRGGGMVSFHEIETVDVWVRDYGPTYVVGEDRALVKWGFNAWGNKYEDLLPDDQAGEMLAESTGLRVFRPGIVLEGGSIDVNGQGSLLTTEQCLLNPNRNPEKTKETLERVLKDYLGVTNVVWLKSGIEGDDTDGHIDDIARFVGPRTAVVAAERETGDANKSVLDLDFRLMQGSSDERGRGLEVIELPMPPRADSSEGRLPRSHLNFYIGNGVVLVPTFGGESDKEAVRVLQGAFPEREVMGIDCRALVHGLGTLHCVTQQAPAAG